MATEQTTYQRRSAKGKGYSHFIRQGRGCTDVGRSADEQRPCLCFIPDTVLCVAAELTEANDVDLQGGRSSLFTHSLCHPLALRISD